MCKTHTSYSIPQKVGRLETRKGNTESKFSKSRMDPNSLLPLSDCIQLPVIDFSDQTLRPGTSEWDKVKANVRKALEDYGCFEALFDKVSTELNKSVFQAVVELFDLPVQTKQRYVSSKPFHGYLNKDLYQSFGIGDANLVEKINDFTEQLWPDHESKRIRISIHKSQ
ncbi:hypothetical protein Bca4012_019090 [Brassica carinata]